MAKTANGKFERVEADQTAYSQLVTEANANWEAADANLKAIETDVSLLDRVLCGTKTAETGAGVSSFDDYLSYPAGYNINNCNVFITSMGTPYGYAILPYAVLKESTRVRVRFVVRDGSIFSASQQFPYAYLFVKMS